MNQQEKHQRERAEKTAQVRTNKGCIVEGHSPGTLLWMTPQRAQFFLGMGVVTLVGGGPTVGPSEFKGGDESKKSYDARSNGPSTDSASSSKRGKGQSSRSSEAGLALHPLNASEFVSSESEKEPSESAPSQSTTRIRSRRGQTSSTSPTTDGGDGTAKTRRSRRGQE